MVHRIAPRLLALTGLLTALVLSWAPPSARAEPGLLPFAPGITIGARMGKVQSDNIEGDALGVYGQLDIGRLGFMGEVGRTSYALGNRIDRVTGGGMTVRLISISDVSLFVRGSLGISRATVDEQVIGDQVYISAGGGVGVLLTRNISLTLEGLMALRQLVRKTDETRLDLNIISDTEEVTHLRLGLAFSI